MKKNILLTHINLFKYIYIQNYIYKLNLIIICKANICKWKQNSQFAKMNKIQKLNVADIYLYYNHTQLFY